MSDEPKDAVAILDAQIRECFGRVVYSHKTHEKCADILLEAERRIQSIQIWLSAITAGGFLVTIIKQEIFIAIIGSLVSTILVALNSFMKNQDYAEKTQEHKKSAAKLWGIRERYFSLMTDIATGLESIGNIRETRDEIFADLALIYEDSPATTSKAYKRAQTALQSQEDLTFNDHEIDAFLPKKLKKL